jgi:preprotein translocase subunit SecA
LLRGLCFAILDEADSVLIDEARVPLIISHKDERDDQETLYREALELAADLEHQRDFRLDPVRREIELTDAGKDRLAERAIGMGALWSGSRRREELVRQALFAREFLIRDQHYLVKDGKIQIIDEYTGRLMPDRSWERGLHQLVETKEGCEVTAQAETLARISYQRFFRRYLRLSGMTGTAREVAGELWSVYRLNLVTVPTNRPLRRIEHSGRVFRKAAAKWGAVVERICKLSSEGRPVLVGTTSVGASEHLSALLTARGVRHQILNARQDQEEAETIANAGQAGTVTVATNMAGRGTDIKLGDRVADSGGLHVIATERHEAGRIDRQLYGRCGRQGDPGSYQYIVSLEDDLVAKNSWRWLARLIPGTAKGTAFFGALIVNLSQRGAEGRYAKIRRRLLKLDEQVGKMLAFSGRME